MPGNFPNFQQVASPKQPASIPRPVGPRRGPLAFPANDNRRLPGGIPSTQAQKFFRGMWIAGEAYQLGQSLYQARKSGDMVGIPEGWRWECRDPNLPMTIPYLHDGASCGQLVSWPGAPATFGPSGSSANIASYYIAGGFTYVAAKMLGPNNGTVPQWNGDGNHKPNWWVVAFAPSTDPFRNPILQPAPNPRPRPFRPGDPANDNEPEEDDGGDEPRPPGPGRAPLPLPPWFYPAPAPGGQPGSRPAPSPSPGGAPAPFFPGTGPGTEAPHVGNNAPGGSPNVSPPSPAPYNPPGVALTPNGPPEVTPPHARLPPGPGTKEKKFAMPTIMRGIVEAAWTATEFKDAVDILWEFLPKDIRNSTPKTGVTSSSARAPGVSYWTLDDKLGALYRNWPDIRAVNDDGQTIPEAIAFNAKSDDAFGRGFGAVDDWRKHAGLSHGQIPGVGSLASF